MGELTAADLELYTGGRLLASTVETTRILNRALVATRTACGWHVTPPKANHVVTLNGPGRRVLQLPTMYVSASSAITSVVEDGVTISVGSLYVSASDTINKGPVRLRKRSGACWSSKYGSIVVTMTHGFAEADAEDWRQAVLDLADRASLKMGDAGSGPLLREKVDDTERQWADPTSSGSGDGYGLLINERLLIPYQITEPV